MSCAVIPDGAAGAMIVCGRPSRPLLCGHPGCGRASVAQCDYQRTGMKRTCDRLLCEVHRIAQPGLNRDYCPDHAARAVSEERDQFDRDRRAHHSSCRCPRCERARTKRRDRARGELLERQRPLQLGPVR